MIQYCSIRCIYDFPDLSNKNYRNNRPSSHIVFGEDKTLLGALSIQIDCINAFLHFINDNYPNKIEKSNLFLEKIFNLDTDIDIFNSESNVNFSIYKKNILNIFKDIFLFLQE